MSSSEFMFQANERNPMGMMGFVVGCGGNETPLMERDGNPVLYVWNTISAEHVYVNLDGEKVNPDFHNN